MSTGIPALQKKKKILIVEDERAVMEALEDKLRREGFFTLTAKDGEEGLKIAIQEKPNLILLDIIMPKMNGVNMLKNLRENVWGKTVPVLLLTNDSNPEHMSETLKANASDYLIKSDWEIDDVLKKVKQTL